MSVFDKVYERTLTEMKLESKVSILRTEQFIRQLFFTTIINGFEWSNTPEFIRSNQDYIEEGTFYSGTMGYFIDDDGSEKIAPAFATGLLLENGLYDTYQMIFPNGRTVIKKLEDIELLFNNYNHTPTIIYVLEMVDKCTTSLNAVELSLIRATFSKLITCKDEQTKKKMLDLIKSSLSQEIPFAITMGDWLNNEIKIDSLYDDKEVNITAIWDIFIRFRNLFFTTFGINTVEISKTERLTMAEGASNDEIVQFTLFNDMYKHRLDFCKRVKEHFGRELTVDVNRGIDTSVFMNLSQEEKLDMKKSIIAPYKEMTINKRTSNNDKEEVTDDEPNS